jgi:hypothetical protein
VPQNKDSAVGYMTRDDVVKEIDGFRLQITKLQVQLDQSQNELSTIKEAHKKELSLVTAELEAFRGQLEGMALSLSQAMSERNMYKAEAHAK